MNTNTPQKNLGSSTPFGSSVGVPQSAPRHNLPHLLPQQPPGGSSFAGHFQLSDPQGNVLTQARYPQGHNTLFQQPQIQSHLQHGQLPNPNAGNSGVLSPSVPTPGTGSAKRVTSRPHSRPVGSSSTNTPSLFKTMELTPAVIKNKRKFPEKKIPDKVAAIVPESALYTQLLEFEGRVDAALARKKLDIQEALKSPPCSQKTLRIYVFNTFSNQGESAADKQADAVPSWSLKITGRILEDGKDPVVTGHAQKLRSSEPKFTSFFKKVTIYLDQNLYPDNPVILWDSARAPVPLEGFDVKRKGDKEFTVVIRLEMNYLPAKFKLSAALKEVLGIEIDTRPRIVAAIWHYVKSKKLQSPHDPSFFMCDSSLQKAFGEEKMKFAMVSQKISQHLTPPQPIHLEHRIKLSGNCPAGLNCYDVLVDVPFAIKNDMTAFLENTDRHKEIDKCDQHISKDIKDLHEHQRRRAFFLAFSQSPADFVNALTVSQNRDLTLAKEDANSSVEKEQRSEFYNQPWTEDAVIRYLNRKSQGSDAP